MNSASPNDGTATITNTGQPKGHRRRRVRHLFWVQEGRVAAELGVDFRRLCGVWGPPERAEYAADPDHVQVVGGLIPLAEPRDCRNCLRVLEARKRRAWEATLA